jgi:hypothetical protein
LDLGGLRSKSAAVVLGSRRLNRGYYGVPRTTAVGAVPSSRWSGAGCEGGMGEKKNARSVCEVWSETGDGVFRSVKHGINLDRTMIVV